MRRHHLDLGALVLATVGSLVVFILLVVWFLPFVADTLGPPTTLNEVIAFLAGALPRVLVGLLAGLLVTARAGRRPTAVSTAAPGFLGSVLAFFMVQLAALVIEVSSGQAITAAPLSALNGMLQWSVEGGLGGLVAYWLTARRRART